ncbi:MAG: DNA-formamidopyrimidine glycosylase [Cyanobacteria bacterium P01_A01_bin.84]
MPELPEVETVKRGLNKLTLNQEITGGDVLLNRAIAYPFSTDEFLRGITRTSIKSWYRRGKYLLAELVDTSSDTFSNSSKNLSSNSKSTTQNSKSRNSKSEFPNSSIFPSSTSSWLGVHLRMTGQLLWQNSAEEVHKHTRVRIYFGKQQDGKQQELRFVDQRTFGKVWWVPPGIATEEVITGLAKLAADPFSKEFTSQYLYKKLENRRRPIKTALLDQSVVSGLGNIYADEALFKSNILPQTLCLDLKPPQIENLHSAIIQVLIASIEAGGTTFSNFLNVQGVNGNYGGVAWVYNRAGEPCKVCGSPIQRIKLAGRSSHFCLQCQN